MRAASPERRRPVRRWELWIPGAYLGLVALSASYLGYRLVFAPTNSEFAGLPVLVLSLPLSEWLAPVAGTNAIGGWLGLLGGVAVNALVLWLFARGLRRALADS